MPCSKKHFFVNISNKKVGVARKNFFRTFKKGAKIIFRTKTSSIKGQKKFFAQISVNTCMKPLFFDQYLKFKIFHCPANPDDLPCQSSFGGGGCHTPPTPPLSFVPGRVVTSKSVQSISTFTRKDKSNGVF
jgi:hypothetical protein